VGVRSPENRLVVIGRDHDVRVEATLPAACVGSDVTVGLFENGGARRVNALDPLFAPMVVWVAPGGQVVTQIRLPDSVPSGLETVYPGATGGCLEFPMVSTEPGLLVGLLDPSENPAASATFVVPRASLVGVRSLLDVPVSLTVFADGIQCTTANLEDQSAKDADGNIRIHVGGPSQPPACSREGALVTFRYPRGELLYEKRNLVLGVSQPFWNLAPEAGESTSGAPSAPDSGQSSSVAPSGTSDGARDLQRAGLIALGLGLTAAVLFKGLRRSSGAPRR
jgi:hypothetical protein